MTWGGRYLYMTLNDGGKVFPASFKPKGYYYTKFSKQFENLTQEELEVRFDLAKELISEAERVNYDYLYFDSKDMKYGDYTRYEVYYAKIGGLILGKLSFTITQVPNDKYNLVMVFSEHLVLPKSHGKKQTRKVPSFKQYSDREADYKKRKRLNDRRWRHNQRHNKHKDVQSED